MCGEEEYIFGRRFPGPAPFSVQMHEFEGFLLLVTAFFPRFRPLPKAGLTPGRSTKGVFRRLTSWRPPLQCTNVQVG